MSAQPFKFDLNNRRKEFEALLQAADAWAGKVLPPGATHMKMRLVLDEIVGNIISYGIHPAGGDRFPIKVTVEWDEEILRITIRDGSTAFNPLDREPPELDIALADRRIGGLGIHLVRKTMDHVEYRFDNGQNILTLTQNIGLNSEMPGHPGE